MNQYEWFTVQDMVDNPGVGCDMCSHSQYPGYFINAYQWIQCRCNPIGHPINEINRNN